MRTITVDGIDFKQPYHLGNYGEKILTKLLPGAVHINDPSDKRLNYDVVWNGIKIDVKFTTVQYYGNIYKFRFNWSYDHRDVVLVHMAYDDGKYYYWIQRYGYRCQLMFKPVTSLTVEELPEAILQLSKTPILITNKEIPHDI